MAYLLSQRAATFHLTDEEVIVLRALAGYCFEPFLTTPLDFIPTSVLYDAYRRYAHERGESPHLILNAQGFGVALRRVFSIAPGRKTKRRYRGRPTWGYIYVEGPGSIKVQRMVGRPKRDSNRAS